MIVEVKREFEVSECPSHAYQTTNKYKKYDSIKVCYLRVKLYASCESVRSFKLGTTNLIVGTITY